MSLNLHDQRPTYKQIKTNTSDKMMYWIPYDPIETYESSYPCPKLITPRRNHGKASENKHDKEFVPNEFE